ncbi:hypothetical protein BDW62DRAFT_217877 [Aspergillus aurantiobrunneus]
MPEYTQLELRALNGPEYQREIPIIDLAPIDRGLEGRKQVAAKIRAAAANTGFFCIKNHGISELIQRALRQAQAFVSQTSEEKERVSHSRSENNDGYLRVGTTQINNEESRVAHSSSLTDESSFNAQEYIWVGTNRLPGFKTTVEFHEARLTHARKMICLFALALALPEDYFDAVTTHPGTPGLNPSSLEAINIDIGIDPHTDIQCFTLLWQDNSGGLQSTVYRVYNWESTSRYPMPLEVNPESHPELYEPISCGKWHCERLALAQETTVA